MSAVPPANSFGESDDGAARVGGMGFPGRKLRVFPIGKGLYRAISFWRVAKGTIFSYDQKFLIWRRLARNWSRRMRLRKTGFFQTATGGRMNEGPAMIKLTRSTTVSDYSLVSTFQELRRQLERYKSTDDRLQKPLAYWVVPSDRRLPLAFMHLTVAELIATPLEELFATAGIGQKKIRTLLTLLHRAAQPRLPGEIVREEELQDPAFSSADKNRDSGDVDPSIVSQALWTQWRESLRQHGLGSEPLGRFAASLRRLPRVIWNTSLDNYLSLDLDEIRSLKTHGEKRVTAVLEIFGTLHALLVHMSKHPHLAVRIVPRIVASQEAWLSRRLESAAGLTIDEIRQSFLAPLVEQVRVDAGNQIARLVENRLNPHGPTVRQSAQRLNLTRARIYQLLGEAAAVIAVRWPDGAVLVKKLLHKLNGEKADADVVRLLETGFDLFFSGSGADSERLESSGRSMHQPTTTSARKSKPHATSGAKETAHVRRSGNGRAHPAAKPALRLRNGASSGR